MYDGGGILTKRIIKRINKKASSILDAFLFILL